MRQSIIVMSLLTWMGSALAATIELQPVTQNVTLGAQTIVLLKISGLGNGIAPSIGTFDIDLQFDPAILTFDNAVFGNQLDVLGLGDIQVVTPVLGVVNLFELSLDFESDLDTLQAPEFTLATLVFESFGTGTSPLALSLNALGDAAGNSLDAELIDGAITVSEASIVPEPSYLSIVAAVFAIIVARLCSPHLIQLTAKRVRSH
jgi:hypothetical protein